MSITIGVDLDEVLAELLDYILEYNDYKIWNIKINKNDVKYYYIHKQENIGITVDDAIKWFREPMYNDVNNYEISPVNKSKEKLIELKSKWYTLIVVTARIEELFWDYTKKWLDIHFPWIFNDIIFADHFNENHREKSEICIENWISYMIEDNYDYAMELANAWIKTYLIEKPWNNWHDSYHENVIKIKWWEELEI